VPPPEPVDIVATAGPAPRVTVRNALATLFAGANKIFAIDSLIKTDYTPAAPQGVSGNRSLKISNQHSAEAASERRPTADRWAGRGLQGQKDQKNHSNQAGKNDWKRASTARSPLGRIALWLLFSTKRLWGVGVWLRVHRQRVAKVGFAELDRSTKICWNLIRSLLGDPRRNFHEPEVREA